MTVRGCRAGAVRTPAIAKGGPLGAGGREGRTICRAAMHTVLIENLRPHMSKRSSRLGPRRSMTRMLCRPSWPKWYICGMPAACVARARWERRTPCSAQRVGPRREGTHGSRPGCGTSGTRRAAVVLPPCAVPTHTTTTKVPTSIPSPQPSAKRQTRHATQMQITVSTTPDKHRAPPASEERRAGRGPREGEKRTNLMATVRELRRFVPAAASQRISPAPRPHPHPAPPPAGAGKPQRTHLRR